MNWLKKTRDSLKSLPKDEKVHPKTIQALTNLLAKKTQSSWEKTNSFLEEFEKSLFDNGKIPIRGAAFATGLVAATLTATLIPGMENPLEGIQSAWNAANIYFQGTEAPSQNEVQEARDKILPALQALSILPAAILFAELLFHGKNTLKKGSQPPEPPISPEP